MLGRQMNRPGVIVIALLGALLGGLLIYGVAQQGDDTSLDAAIRDGKRPAAPEPALALPRLEGSGTSSLADYRGKIVVLNFWASWCTPCRQEAPLLSRFQQKLDGRGTVLGVTYKDDPAASLAFAHKYELGYPSLRDSKLELAPKYGTRALPETFVIDGRGRIVAVSRGQVNQEFLDNALSEAAS
jgi:cytochrome c biogenesis protein CcmG/thiol:disulfide interchange protein DsbE